MGVGILNYFYFNLFRKMGSEYWPDAGLVLNIEKESWKLKDRKQGVHTPVGTRGVIKGEF